MNDPGRRPIEPWELPLLEAMGVRLRELRRQVGVSTEALASHVHVAPTTVWRIESARRRTRRRMLEILVGALVEAQPELGQVDALVDELVALAGAALAPPSPHQERIEKRRARRIRRQLAEQQRWRRMWEES